MSLSRTSRLCVRTTFLSMVGIILAPSAWADSAQAPTAPQPPDVVPSLDLNSYLGKWYEVASTRPEFQVDCYCTTAEYSLDDATTPIIGVQNSCNRGSAFGPRTSVRGRATIPDLTSPTKLSVTFGGPFPAKTNYWIVALAEDYSYAVVSSAERNPIFLLSRTRTLPAETLQAIVRDLDTRGFETERLDFSGQIGCQD